MRRVTGNVRRFLRQSLAAKTAILSFAIFFLLAPLLALRAEDDAMPGMHDGMAMPMDSPNDAVIQAARQAWKRESEFNHHLAGLLVLAAGLLILADGSVRQRWSVARHVWPICFLASGIFLLIFSDTELWPFGSQSWYFGLTHNAEVLQHKVFAVLLLGLGLVELQRERGVLKARWSGWVFPAAAAAGSLMLFFHNHQGGMHGPDHMQVMQRIQSEHFSFAVTGFGIALSKGLSEKPSAWQPFFERLFPTLLIVLGALLMVYVE
jgi:putative copper resistance protein D